VFVDLYLKAQRRAEELSRSVEAIEEAATQLARTPAAAADPQTQDALARLNRRISQLRESLRNNS
jgi:transcription elongation GreA/GreB family factor